MKKLFSFSNPGSADCFNAFFEENKSEILFPSYKPVIVLKGTTLLFDDKRITKEEAMNAIKTFTNNVRKLI